MQAVNSKCLHIKSENIGKCGPFLSVDTLFSRSRKRYIYCKYGMCRVRPCIYNEHPLCKFFSKFRCDNNLKYREGSVKHAVVEDSQVEILINSKQSDEILHISHMCDESHFKTFET